MIFTLYTLDNTLANVWAGTLFLVWVTSEQHVGKVLSKKKREGRILEGKWMIQRREDMLWVLLQQAILSVMWRVERDNERKTKVWTRPYPILRPRGSILAFFHAVCHFCLHHMTFAANWGQVTESWFPIGFNPTLQKNCICNSLGNIWVTFSPTCWETLFPVYRPTFEQYGVRLPMFA